MIAMMIAAMPMPSVGQGSGATVGSAVAAQALPTQAEPTQADKSQNGRKRLQIQAVLKELLDFGVTKGFFGSVTLNVTFHDGSIQHITRQMEQLIKK